MSTVHTIEKTDGSHIGPEYGIRSMIVQQLHVRPPLMFYRNNVTPVFTRSRRIG